ncbi:MAG: M48 family peptidase [Terriglobales bacterium]
MSLQVAEIFQQAYAELRARTPAPPMHIRFYPFVSINNTIRLRQAELYIRLSDLLEGAPDPVLHAIAHILLAKLYRKPIDRALSARYRRYVASHDLAAKARLVRQMRGRKHIDSARGHHYHLEEIFDDLNGRFFHGLMGRPQLTWSRDHARNRLGHYDPAHNAIVISRVFDDPRVPRFVVEYILYHEMLHLKHPVKLRGSRRCVHSREFVAEENLFPEVAQAKKFLRII